jgi:DNA polymerase III alpha subunit
MRYNNYHKHDHVSNIFSPDTNTKQEEYILKALEYGHTSYFTTNHGSFGDIFEARTLCNKYGIKCIAGIEGYIVPDASEKDKRNYHIVVIPKTDETRKKMNYVSSMANINGFYYKPRFFMKDLLALDKNDVYITTACVAGLLRDEDSIEKIFKPLFKHFGNNIMLEVQTHLDPVQIEVNKKAIYYSDEYGLSLIAANDSHYIDESGKQERLELLKGKHINYGSEDDFILDYPTAETMIERFKKQNVLSDNQINDAINNTLIFDNCEEIKLDYSIKMPTIYPNLTPNQRVKLLKQEINKRFKVIREQENISDNDFKRYRDGIRYEMKIIEDTNDEVHTADYFLFNEKNVDLAVNKYGGVLTRGGRGSCGSFYINRILGMTQLDRFKINLPLFPDRFASTARLLENRSLPDIDFNVKSQEPFVKASRELLGEHGCYPMYAPGTMQISEAFRNVCRSKGMDFDEFNDVAKNLEAYENDEKWKPIIEEANKYVGTIVSGSVHPCAHILSDKNLLYEYGVTRLGENLCVLITSSEADEYKVLKNDYLIVKVWKLIDETFKEIGKPIITANELLRSIKDDKRIWDLFKNGITCTLNQVDSDNGSQQAKRYKVSSFEDGAHLTAAIRPSFDSWREQFLNREDYTTGSEQLDKVLNDTHGYILFQESLMQYFDWLGVTPAESIGLIKKISKKKIKPEDFANLEERIRKQWIINTGSEDGFDTTWQMIQSCMSYGFCSAHAAATSLDMCYGAYLKVNYPLEYYSVCFNNYSDDQVRTNKLKKELDYFNIKLSDIKFRHSTSKYSYNRENNTIYKGMSSIKYIGDNVGDDLYALKDNKYDDFIDLLIDIKNTSVNSKQLEILIKLNFFSEFGEINTLLKQVDYFDKVYGKKQFKIDKLEELGLPKDIVKLHCKKQTEKIWKDFDSVSLLKDIIKNVEYKETSLMDIFNYQQELYGYVSYVQPTANKRLYYVSNINSTKYLTTITLYEIYSGKTRTVKMWTSAYNRNPFNKGAILYIISLEKKNKKEPTGEINPVTGKKIYKEVPDKFEFWLSKFVIKNDIEEDEDDI